jgi:DNA-binding XRE family transcriptional regulator
MAKVTNQFKLARVLSGYTQREISDKSGVSMTTIVKIEKGEYSDLKPLTKVAKALNKKVTITLE